MSSPAILSTEPSQGSAHGDATDTQDLATTAAFAQTMTTTSKRRASTPDAPPWSPITPTLSSSQLPDIPLLPALSPGSRRQRSSRANQQQQQPQLGLHSTRRPVDSITHPPPAIPISDSTNPDVVALRAALDVLQLQRMRSLKDISVLRQQKELALARPQAFAEALARGELDGEGQVDELRLPDEETDEDESETKQDEGPYAAGVTDFEPFPSQQEIARCPPVNWARYQVVGEVLDRLYEEQRRRPSTGRGNAAAANAEWSVAPEHVVMAPYRPFVDDLNSTVAGSGEGGGGLRKRSG